MRNKTTKQQNKLECLGNKTKNREICFSQVLKTKLKKINKDELKKKQI